MRNHLLSAALVALLPLTATGLLCTCSGSSSNSNQPANDGGSGGVAEAADDGGNADAEPPWDPVWHLTQPKEWPTVADVTDCGPGCRIGLHHPPMHAAYYGHAYDLFSFADVNTDVGALFFSRIANGSTYLIGQRVGRADGFGQPYVHGDRVVYLHVNDDETRTVEVASLITGEVKVVHQYRFEAGAPVVTLTALNSTHAFWDFDGVGMMSRNLQTGELRVLAPGSFACSRICTTDQGIVCSNRDRGRMEFIDQQSGSVEALDDGGALQTEGSCSPDRTRAVWVDYRDPPGQNSDEFAPRSGGEIYTADLKTRKVERLTHDSPDSPTGKTYPAIDGSLVAWKQPKLEYDQNPWSGQDLHAAADDLIVLDRATGAKCRIDSPLVEGFKYISAHGRTVYGYGDTPAGKRTLLLGVDVDHEALGCEPY